MSEKEFPNTYYDKKYFENMACGNRQIFRESQGQQLHEHRRYYINLLNLKLGMRLRKILLTDIENKGLVEYVSCSKGADKKCVQQ